jgi:hypothetical protein
MQVRSIAILIQAFAIHGGLIGACRMDEPKKTCGRSGMERLVLQTPLSRRSSGLSDVPRLKVIIRPGGAWGRTPRFWALDRGGPFEVLAVGSSVALDPVVTAEVEVVGYRAQPGQSGIDRCRATDGRTGSWAIR